MPAKTASQSAELRYNRIFFALPTFMKGKARKLLLAITLAVVAGIYLLFIFGTSLPEYPHFTLSDGAEFRVVQITYTAGPSNFPDHNLGGSKKRWWLHQHLPRPVQKWMQEPDSGIDSEFSDRPMLSIWWARFDRETQEPLLGPAGDVLMKLDSGKVVNLGWPDPGEDYRQILITDPPTDSKQLTFTVPVEEELVRFTIKNPAYRP